MKREVQSIINKNFNLNSPKKKTKYDSHNPSKFFQLWVSGTTGSRNPSSDPSHLAQNLISVSFGQINGNSIYGDFILDISLNKWKIWTNDAFYEVPLFDANAIKITSNKQILEVEAIPKLYLIFKFRKQLSNLFIDQLQRDFPSKVIIGDPLEPSLNNSNHFGGNTINCKEVRKSHQDINETIATNINDTSNKIFSPPNRDLFMYTRASANPYKDYLSINPKTQGSPSYSKRLKRPSGMFFFFFLF